MDGHSSWLARKLRERLEAALENRIGALSKGFASDFPDYRERIGYIKCLRETLDEIDAADGEFEKRKS